MPGSFKLSTSIWLLLAASGLAVEAQLHARSDDVTMNTLMTLLEKQASAMQQQAATIQALQARLGSLEARVTANAASITSLNTTSDATGVSSLNSKFAKAWTLIRATAIPDYLWLLNRLSNAKSYFCVTLLSISGSKAVDNPEY